MTTLTLTRTTQGERTRWLAVLALMAFDLTGASAEVAG